MKKKYLVFSLIAALSLSACGNPNDNSSGGDNQADNIKTAIPVASMNATSEHSFTTELADEYALYPESTGRTYYVSAKGNDSNNGLSESKPLKTISAVNSLDLKAGDSVLFKRGEAFSGAGLTITASGDDDNPITIGAYGDADARPILTYRGTVVTFTEVSNLVIKDLEIAVQGEDLTETSATRFGITGKYSIEENEETKYKNIYIDNNVVYSGSVGTNVFGITIQASYPVFEGGPEGALDNVHIVNNQVYNVGQSGINSTLWISEGEANGNTNGGNRKFYTNMHVDNNVIHDVGYLGTFLMCAKESSINRNEVYKTGMTPTEVRSTGDCGIMALSCEDTDIMYNITYDNRKAFYTVDAMGIDIDWNTVNINVQYNYCYGSVGPGIGTMACQDSFIRNNKVVDNKCETVQASQIEVGDYTSRYDGVADDMHDVENLQITDNLTIVTNPQPYKSFFSTRADIGDPAWTGNTYERNHNVIINDDANGKYYWIEVSADRPWYKFADNMYFGTNPSFRAFDMTQDYDINPGAQVFSGDYSFEEWVKRDVGSTYQAPDYTRPAQPTGLQVTYADNKVSLSWTKDANVWHYNVYLVGETEEASYRNMLGESFDGKFSYEPKAKGTYYLIVEPESNVGVTGTPLKIKVELK